MKFLCELNTLHSSDVIHPVPSSWKNLQFPNIIEILEAVARRCPVKKVFVKISQNLQENTCARVSFLIKLQAYNFIKKETRAQVFYLI